MLGESMNVAHGQIVAGVRGLLRLMNPALGSLGLMPGQISAFASSLYCLTQQTSQLLVGSFAFMQLLNFKTPQALAPTTAKQPPGQPMAVVK